MNKLTNKDMIHKWSQVTPDYLDKYGEEGDLSKRYLLNPAIFKCLGNFKGKRILEVGCGSGYLCRMLAKQGAIVTGLEPSETMVNYARKKESENLLGIEYLQEDLSTYVNKEDEFDVVIANMVFLDIPDYQTAMRNCISSLKNGGDFIFSLAHPCFFSDKDYFEEYSIEQKFGDSFHRTLSTYINLVISEGCNIKEVIEPELDLETAQQHPEIANNARNPNFIVIHAVKN